MAAISITPANVKPSNSATLATIILGATLTAGQVVYRDPTTKEYFAARADDESTALVGGMGILASGGAQGQRAVLVTADSDLTIGGTVSDAVVLALSATTAGAIVPITDLVPGDDVVLQRIFGTGKPGNKIAVNFGRDRVISGEIAAS